MGDANCLKAVSIPEGALPTDRCIAEWPDGLTFLVNVQACDLFEIQEVKARVENGSSWWTGEKEGERVKVHSPSDRKLLVAIAQGKNDRMVCNLKVYWVESIDIAVAIMTMVAKAWCEGVHLSQNEKA